MKTKIHTSFENRIKTEFPKVNWTDSQFIESGWDHFVLILDNKLVFRTPKDSRYTEIFANELSFMSYLNKRIKTRIPNYKYISKDRTFAGYEIIQGRQIDTELFNKMSESEKTSLAEQVAVFITETHRVPASVKYKFNIKTSDYIKDLEELEDKSRRMIFPKLGSEEIGKIEKYFIEFRKMLLQKHDEVFLHNDLGGEHVFLDDNTGKIGVIDFSDSEFGDPAYDFAGMIEFGNEFTQQVIGLYQGRKNDDFLYRSEMYFKRVPLFVMIDSVEGFPCTFEQGYEMLKRFH